MKVGTITTVLKCMRARLESNNGFIQVGKYEIFALTAAGHVLNDVYLLQFAKTACLAQDNQDIPKLLKSNKETYESIRKAYKVLAEQFEEGRELSIDETTGKVEVGNEPLPAELGNESVLNQWLKFELDSPLLSEFRPE